MRGVRGLSLLSAVALLTGVVLWPGVGQAAYRVTAQTTQCNGDTGFTTFSVYDLYKIQTAHCADPNNPGQKLKQVLLKSHSGLTRYKVIMVTPEEAERIQRQVTGPPPRPQRPAPPTQPRQQPQPVPSPPQGDATTAGGESEGNDYRKAEEGGDEALEGPSIAILDPPVANTRATPRVVTRSGSEGRTVVGKVEAPAGVHSVTVNGAKPRLEDNGLFETTVAMKGDRTAVKVVAVDKQGKRQSFDFWLVPEDIKEDAATDGDEASEGFGEYYALVVGNNEYKHFNDLETAVNDAQTVASVLHERYGFQVTTLTNVTRYELVSELARLRKKLTEKDNLLLYYAGHGEYDKVNQRGHWLPVDAEPDNTANWVSTVDITDSINRMSAKHVLVVADSCYSGALTRSTTTELDPGMSEDARQKWLSVMAKQRSRTVLTSGGLKPVLDNGGGKHSIFAKAFIQALRDNNGVLEGTQLYRQLKDPVASAAESLGIKQVPEYAPLKQTGHEFSDFLLVAHGGDGG